MPYMPPGWLPCGASITARTYWPGNRTRSACRRMKSVETIFSTVTTAPCRAAIAPYMFSLSGAPVITLPARSAAQPCSSATSGTSARTYATRPSPPKGSSAAMRSPLRALSSSMEEPSSERVGRNGTPIAPASRRSGKLSIDQFDTSRRPSSTAREMRAWGVGNG